MILPQFSKKNRPLLDFCNDTIYDVQSKCILWTVRKLFIGEFDGKIATQTQSGQQETPGPLEGTP
jgi:hypothetical protein